MLKAEELLAGSSLTFEVQVPPEVLHPNMQEAPLMGMARSG